MHTFVLARVTKTQRWLPDLSDLSDLYRGGRQRATLEVLEWAYNQPIGAQEPTTIELIQNRLGGCTLDEQTNLLRAGGVYLLPLMLVEGEYYLMGDMDVLFEADEQGLIYSHSDFEALAAYDGKPWETLMEDVRAIVRDDPLLPAYSKLARMLRPDASMTLTEITITGPETQTGEEYGHTIKVRQAQLERTLFTGSQGKLPTEFSLKTSVWREDREIVTQPGERYLLFVDQYEGEFLMEGNRAAIVNSDGTVTPVYGEKDPGWNYFSPFSQLAGMTVEQVQLMIEKAG